MASVFPISYGSHLNPQEAFEPQPVAAKGQVPAGCSTPGKCNTALLFRPNFGAARNLLGFFFFFVFFFGRGVLQSPPQPTSFQPANPQPTAAESSAGSEATGERGRRKRERGSGGGGGRARTDKRMEEVSRASKGGTGRQTSMINDQTSEPIAILFICKTRRRRPLTKRSMDNSALFSMFRLPIGIQG